MSRPGQCLEKGTLQNQLFDDPASKTHAFMRGVVRSRFLRAMAAGAKKKGNPAADAV